MANNAISSGLLANIAGIDTEKTFSTSSNKTFDSHPAPDVNDFTKGRVAFSDTTLTDRGSANAAEAPAGSTDNDRSWSDAALDTARAAANKVSSVLPSGLTGKDAEKDHLQKQQDEGPSAGKQCVLRNMA